MKVLKLKKGHEEEVESEGTWAISYGDMITLLLSFFVIFFTTDFDKQKQQTLNEHVMADIIALDFISDKKLEKQASGTTDLQGSGTQKLSEKFAGDLAKVEVIPWKENLIVKFSDVSFFKSGQVELTKEGEKVIRAFSEKYLPYAGQYKLSVKAFTDRRKVLKVTGRFKDNLELSALRAVSAMRELEKTGIPLTRIDIAGYGEMVKIQNYLGKVDQLTDEQKNALSRTIVMIIKPEKEESFL